MTVDIENACHWLEHRDPSYTGDRLLYRAGKRAAGLAADEYDSNTATGVEWALVALDLCPLARGVGFSPNGQRLIGCEQVVGLAHVTAWIYALTLQLPSRRSVDAPVVLAKIFAVLERRCVDAGTTLGEAMDTLLAHADERPGFSMDALASADCLEHDRDATHAA